MNYNLLISHVKKDEKLAEYVVKNLDGYTFELGKESITVRTVYMEDSNNGCFGDFIVWSENAVRNADGVLAIISPNTLEQTIIEGVAVNKKIVYDEISLAKELFKDVIIAKDQDIAGLEIGYRLLLQNISSFCYSDFFTENNVEIIKNSVRLHAVRRFGGDPLIEYAGKINDDLSYVSIRNSGQFVGRSDELSYIDDCFDSDKPIVCILGFGGMGKTTLSKMYAYTHPRYSVYIYNCQDNTTLKSAIINFEFTYQSDDFDKLSSDEKYKRNLHRLKKLQNDVLIIIDNFNGDFAYNENLQVMDEMSDIPKCKFIITSRNVGINRQDVGVINIGAIECGRLKEMFYRDSRLPQTPENDELIDKLFDITDNHTMTIELVAKAIANDENAVTLQEVIDNLLDKDGVKTRLEDNARSDGFSEYDTIYNHITKLFALSNLTKSQKYVVGCLSFVPNDGLTSAEIKEAINEHSPKNVGQYSPELLSGLVRSGYVLVSDDNPKSYYLHPIMRDIISKKCVFNVNTFYYFAYYVINQKASYRFYDSIRDVHTKIRYAVTIWGKPYQRDNWEGYDILSYTGTRLGLFYQELGDDNGATFYWSKALSFLRKYVDCFQSENSILTKSRRDYAQRQIAFLNKSLADAYNRLGQNKSAESFYRQSIRANERIAENADSPDEIARCYHEYYIIYNQTGDYQEARKCLTNSIRLMSQRYGTLSSKMSLACYYYELACLEMVLNENEDARKNLYEALKIYQEIKTDLSVKNKIRSSTDERNRVDLIAVEKNIAVCYTKLGSLYEILGDKKSAEDYFTVGISSLTYVCAESQELEYKGNLAWAYDSASAFYFDVKRFYKSKKMAKKAVETFLEVVSQTERTYFYDKLTDYLISYEFANIQTKPILIRLIYGFVLAVGGNCYAKKIYKEYDLNYEYFMKSYYARLSRLSTIEKYKKKLKDASDLFEVTDPK